jgi:protein-S-isoprenylcysteine O-methyltransferase Ste14
MVGAFETVRDVVALFFLICLPPAMLYWVVIHPFARFWRRVGPRVTVPIVLGICAAVGLVIASFREPLLAWRWLFHWPLALLGLLVYAVGVAIEVACRRHLRLSVLLGGPELGGGPGRLLTEGIYARTRNPRYLAILVAVLGWALAVNLPAVYILWLVAVPGFYGIILLEERELEDRFGAPYEEYLRRVPRILPRLGG